MTEYVLLIIIMVFIYFVLIRNKEATKSDWETLPTQAEYLKINKAQNEQGEQCCQYCGNLDTIQRELSCKKENPDNSKFYHACTKCKVVLWRSQIG